MALSKSTLHSQLQAGCMSKEISLQDPSPCQASHLYMLVDSSINVEWGWRGLDQCAHSVVLRPPAAASLGNLSEMQILRLRSRLTESATMGVEPRNLGLTSLVYAKAWETLVQTTIFQWWVFRVREQRGEVMAVGASWGHWPLILRVKAGTVFWSNQGPQGKSCLQWGFSYLPCAACLTYC